MSGNFDQPQPTTSPGAHNRYAERIHALLLKAESTDSDAEAQALAAKASELLVKYNVEQVEIDALRCQRGEPKGTITRRVMWFGGTHSLGLASGSSRVIKALHDGAVVVLRSSGSHYDYQQVSNGDTRKGYYLFLHGYESDIEQCELLLASLTMQAINAMRRWWAQESGHWRMVSDALARRSYIQGFLEGAAEKIQQSRRTVLSEAAAGTALALRDRGDEVSLWMGENGFVSAGMCRSASRCWTSSDAGQQAGRQADVGHQRVRARSALT